MTPVRGKEMRSGLIGCALALALLAGCSKSPEAPAPEAAPVENVAEAPPPPPSPTVEAPAEKPPAPAENSADALPPEEPLAPDEQTLEDADATGLTARSTTPPDVVTEPSADPVAEPVTDELGGDAQ